MHKELRNMVVFATHNLLADPPFTQLDLLSCRNVLIYLQPATQRQLLSVFHYALLPHSYLLLGSSESIDGCVDRLTPLDTPWRIFQRQEAPTTPWPAVDLPPLARQAEAQGTTPRFPAKRSGPSFVMAIERLLTQRFAPPSVLVDSRGEVIYIHGRTGQFLQPAHGLQMRQHLLSMVHEGLQLELAMALSQATSSQESIRTRAKVETPSGPTVVEVTVQAVTNPEILQGLSLVTFHAHPPVATQLHRRQRRHSSQEQVITLEHELQQLQETLLGRTQAAYIFNEELQATNEEWQAANEELQSAKEEMESLNEELQTVNSELREKVQSLAGANDDLQNLLNATGIATLFLDSQLHIKRFTPQVTRLIKMIPSDVGRPIGDLVSTLAYDRLEADAQEVLETLLAKEMLVVTHDGEWYGVRMVPYRTSENAIDGIIITFIDISRFKVTAEV